MIDKKQKDVRISANILAPESVRDAMESAIGMHNALRNTALYGRMTKERYILQAIIEKNEREMDAPHGK
jgi:hypothetical protein